ncbi:hypothetical protein ACIGW8_15120 [Streptomyces sioyaensis]|uniref:hypothetical protein n=1 Tax=Streptomyces sioyaensis TaxID=67364 RepID=UPI0037D6CBBC
MNPVVQHPVAYQLNLPDGTVRRYFTRQEADAANQRTGNTGIITVVPQSAARD